MTRSLRALAVAVSLLFAQGPLFAQQPSSSSSLLSSLSSDLVALLSEGGLRRVPVIVGGDLADVDAAVAQLDLPVVRRLQQFVVVMANGVELQLLREHTGVRTLSGDVPVFSSMTVSDRVIAADQARQGRRDLLSASSVVPVSGAGVGVAIIDSGIAPHRALDGKVVASVSFVPGDASGHDGYGHGTHVAGIVTGHASAAAGIATDYAGGIAPGAHLVNVRVLGNDGTGRTSDVLAGIEWVVANRARYRIRVINLSLGHPITEPSLTDPLNAAVARATAEGIFVVASAGNRGKATDGSQQLASITSPGNSPHLITVGALNTKGTVDRSDDLVATYSSRGPTMFELAMKPDVVAPGNKIVSLEAAGSLIATRYAQDRVAGAGSNAYFRMSGTSMAAPMVAGAAALVLEGSPAVTPRQLKMAFQAGASFMPEAGLLASGAGNINVLATRRLAIDGFRDLAPLTTIGGTLVRPGGVVVSHGTRLLDAVYQQVGVRALSLFDQLFVWADPSRLPLDRVNLLGLTNPLARVGGDRIVWGDLHTWSGSQRIVWGDHVFGVDGQRIVWSDTTPSESNRIVWSDSGPAEGNRIVWSDSRDPQANRIVWSDSNHTEGNRIVWSDSRPTGDR